MPQKTAPRAAVWNTAFLGDAVLTLPLVQALRLAGAEVDLYTRKGFESLLGGYGVKKGGIRSWGAIWGAEIRPRRYDIWISAHLSLRSSLMALRSGAGFKAGYSEAALAGMVYDKTVSRQFERREEVERLLGLLEPVLDHLPRPDALKDILAELKSGGRSSLWPELKLPVTAEAEAEKLLDPLTRQARPILALHPGSVWPTKRWPLEYFAKIARRAVEAGACAVIFAGPGEETPLLELAGLSGHERVLDLSGRTSLPVLAAALAVADLYLTNDSGPMHLAWAQRTPVTALFGPTVRALGFFPRGEGATVMELPLPCRPCGLHGHKQCPLGHHECMRGLTPDMVWPDVERKL